MFTSDRRQWATHGRAVTMFVYEKWMVICAAALVMGTQHHTAAQNNQR